MQITFHWQAVLLAAMVGVAIPALWYSPLAFLRVWLSLNGLDEERFKATFRPLAGVGLAALAALLQALCLDAAFLFTGSNSFGMGALAGLQLSLALVLPPLALEHALARRPWRLLGLNAVPILLNAVLMGGLIASLR
jgi:hypothetical protein